MSDKIAALLRREADYFGQHPKLGIDERSVAGLLRNAADHIEALDKDVCEAEDELAHAYWDSCGCLAGGIGHAKGSPECLASMRVFKRSESEQR